MEELHRKREEVKAKLTRFGAHIASASINSDPNFVEIRIRIRHTEKLLDEFDEIQQRIEEKAADVTQERQERSEFEAAFFSTMATAETLLAAAPGVSGLTRSHDTSNISSHQNSPVKLPPINLITFDGSYEEWGSFCDTFNSLIHSNPSLKPVEKFHYLKASLVGEAANVLLNLETTERNYSTAWTLMKERYENKKAISQLHIKGLFELPQVQKENFRGLRCFLDNTNKHIRALKALGHQPAQWDVLLLYLLSSKLDPTSRREWEIKSAAITGDATIEDLCTFLQQKCQLLDTLNLDKTSHRVDTPHVLPRGSNRPGQRVPSNTYSATQAETNASKCPVCDRAAHKLYACQKFMTMTPELRSQEVKKHNLCFNCLSSQHRSVECQAGFCKKCSRKHNTLLHTEVQANLLRGKQDSIRTATDRHQGSHCSMTEPSEHPQRSFISNEQRSVDEAHFSGTAQSSPSVSTNKTSSILLTTAVVEVVQQNKQRRTCRVLLDSGSEVNFVTKNTVRELGLKPHTLHIPIRGIGGTATNVTEAVDITIKSRINSYKATLRFLVLPKITNQLPVVKVDVDNFHVPANICLADPDFHTPSTIDMLIGAEIYMDLLCVGQIKRRHQPTLQNTVLGWLVSGKINSNESPSELHTYHVSCHSAQADEQLSNQLKAFWEIEEMPSKPTYTSEEQACETHFTETHTREESGRFVVKLPFKDNVQQLGESETIARRRFKAMETKFARNTELHAQYQRFMQEYLELGHMQLTENDDHTGFYLPHHAVFKQDSLTTKIRVVFDGSCKTSTGLSLNETLMKGPTIQDELFAILLRFRCYTWVLTADIEKMYRQIKVHQDDTHYQKILWRNTPDESVQAYRLTTVTYGTTSAPFLAVRSLQELAHEHSEHYRLASRVVLQDFYIDDAITGAFSHEEARQLQSELTHLLKLGGFDLHKWRSNDPGLLQEKHTENGVYTIPQDNIETAKTLGLIWDSNRDVLKISISQGSIPHAVSTKRTILSSIAQIFDPLGLIGPIILRAKLIVQKLWQLQLDWDDTLPLAEHTAWRTLQNELPLLNSVQISRNVVLGMNFVNIEYIELHGFSDASQDGYGACIYVRALRKDRTYTSHLLCSKSRVAPLKTLSIPRLELCAALLLSQLITKVKAALQIPIRACHLWTDSTIVLCWIGESPSTWKVFISNRVTQIQNNTQNDIWHHTPTQDNPADLISRGLTPGKIIHNSLWWNGPTWLTGNSSNWPQNCWQGSGHQETQLEIRSPKIPQCMSATQPAQKTIENYVFDKYSSITKLKRIIALCFRFVDNCLHKGRNKERNTDPLTASEIQKAFIGLIKMSQQRSFRKDITAIKNTGRVSSESKLINLHPFVDSEGLLRVGGRIHNAAISFSQKHPMIMSSEHKLTELLIQQEHRALLHAGPQAVLASLRHRFWPLKGTSTVRKFTKQCVTCFRQNPQVLNPLMGNLPAHRVTPSRPFQNIGIDYAGPILIKENHRRGRVRTNACYVAVFVCLSTKAVHLELVSGLTTEAFLAALKRFMSRRGKPTHIYSDNATNFTRASKELVKSVQILSQQDHWNQIEDFAANECLTWHFIPPRPLWRALGGGSEIIKIPH